MTQGISPRRATTLKPMVALRLIISSTILGIGMPSMIRQRLPSSLPKKVTTISFRPSFLTPYKGIMLFFKRKPPWMRI